jgi:hypothetical protein
LYFSKNKQQKYIFVKIDIDMKTEHSLHSKKAILIQWISNLDDGNVIDKIFELKRDLEDQQFNADKNAQLSIEHGIEDADNGRLQPHSKAIEIYGKW